MDHQDDKAVFNLKAITSLRDIKACHLKEILGGIKEARLSLSTRTGRNKTTRPARSKVTCNSISREDIKTSKAHSLSTKVHLKSKDRRTIRVVHRQQLNILTRQNHNHSAESLY
jgi:hypothetical protein